MKRSLTRTCLSVTGGDRDNLLTATERKFNVQLSSEEHGFRKTFRLAEGEYVFHSEGLDLLGWLIGRKEKVVHFTVEQLYDAVVASQSLSEKEKPAHRDMSKRGKLT